ncbi:MAG: PQQ-binding-like beta-propeller repeat protein, partial [Planctomycetota bacterium]
MKRARPAWKWTAAACSVAILLTSFPAGAADWPTWRHDAGRSAASPEQLPEALNLEWRRDNRPLVPAWPEDPRVHFAAGYEPIVAGGTMFVASSQNDSVTALDTQTGDERWRFYAGGPVRFAPVADDGRVYFGADDG